MVPYSHFRSIGSLMMLFLLAGLMSCQPKITIGLLTFSELELGRSYVDNWQSPIPVLEIDSLDLQDAVFEANHRKANWRIDALRIPFAVSNAKAVNDTLITRVEVKKIFLHNLKVKTKTASVDQNHIVPKFFHRVKIEKCYIESARLSRHLPLATDPSLIDTLRARVQQVTILMDTIEAMQASMSTPDSMHAVAFINPQINAMRGRLSHVLDFLSQYRPDVPNADIEFNMEETLDLLKRGRRMAIQIVDPENAPRRIVIFFDSGRFHMEDIRNKKAIDDYLLEIKQDVGLKTEDDHLDTVYVTLTVTAFADSVPVGTARDSLRLLYGNTACPTLDDNSQSAYAKWNQLLSRARAESVGDYMKQWLESSLQSFGLVQIAVYPNGRGLESPETYRGTCKGWECSDRRVALPSRIIDYARPSGRTDDSKF